MMEDSKSYTNSESSHSMDEENKTKLNEVKDTRVEITRVGYLGSDPDKCKVVNLTKIKVST